MRIQAIDSSTPFSTYSKSSHRPDARKVKRDSRSRQLMVGLLMVSALLAFEIFNFDTTRFALESLLGKTRFINLTWASILAVAFCAIDFAGLAKLFTPQRGFDEPKEVWYLMGAWFLGATMNAVMTWWAVSLALLGSDLGNEVLSREDLLRYAPIFVASLVWLTRILFIGSLAVTGERLIHSDDKSRSGRQSNPPSRPLPKYAPVYSQVQGKALSNGSPSTSSTVAPIWKLRRTSVTF